MDTILLVNDSPTITKILSAHFQRAGFRVLAVNSAMDAYEQYIRNDVHLILTDFIIKDKDGLEVIQTFRSGRSGRHTPIVVFTAIEDEATKQRCRDAGCDLVLAKSSDTQAMLAAIQALIEEFRTKTKTSLDADIGQCIVSSTVEVFRTMMNMRLQAGDISFEKAKPRAADVIGSIGVAGFMSGAISLFMSRAFAQAAAGKMLMLEDGAAIPSEELADAVGELTNMIGGNIKTGLLQKAPLFDISVPNVYIGSDLKRRTISDDLCFFVPFQFGEERFAVEFLLVTKDTGHATTGLQKTLVDSMT